MRMYQFKCAVCGKPFTANRKNAIYCSKACCNRKSKGNRTLHTITCIVCGKKFTSLNPDRKFCSTNCWRAHWSKAKCGKFNDPAQARKIAEIRSAVGKCDGLTEEQMAAVIYAQDKAPASECWALSQKWTKAQRKFAEWRYNERYGVFKGYKF